MTLKPITPTKYDGSPDSKAFHQVHDGGVPSKKRAFILAHYLMGKAREFYVNAVAVDPYKWKLPEFYTELFNYCFPVDFQAKQREKLQRYRQNDLKVRDYLYELNGFWNMIGEEDERTKVTKFWSGLQFEIQRDLWHDKLNPEVSSLKEVVAAAEIVEITRSVVTRDRDRGT